MEVEELDVVQLKDGQVGTVLEIFDDNFFMFEPDDYPDANFPIASLDDIKAITWKASEHKEI